MVAEFKDVAKSYGDKQVLRDINFVIERGDRIALVGVNGAGKSTLIRLLAEIEPVTSGERRLGHNVEVDYFAQDQYKQLNPEERVLDDLERLAPHATQTELRSLLGCFLFSHDDVFKRIEVLSGGERNRYALARLLLFPSNFLLLDEPTNHLDLRAKDTLLAALEAFSGTVVFVSHDRYFIDKLATKVFEVAGGNVNVYPGNYEDYRWRKEKLADAVAENEVVAASGNNGQGSAPSPEPETTAKGRRMNPIRLRQMEERRHELEEHVARLEAEIIDCESALTKFVSAQETARLAALLEQRRTELQQMMAEWEEISLAIEGLG
jgi:ATP-binding cassette subfamily F protein 3